MKMENSNFNINETDDLSSSNDLQNIDFELSEEKVFNEVTNNNSQIPATDCYKYIIEHRKFEIENFWKRALFFWGTLAILIVGYFNFPKDSFFIVFISYLGAIYNIIFCLSLRGSKYWQEHWENVATIYETKLGLMLFRWQARNKIMNNNKKDFFLLRPYRFSVSKLTMILSDITMLFWILLIAHDLRYLWLNNLLHFDFGWDNQIDWFTIIVIVFPTIFIVYLLIFLLKHSPKCQ